MGLSILSSFLWTTSKTDMGDDMTKYVFISKEKENDSTLSYEFKAVTLDEVIEEIKTFLIACSFSAEVVDSIGRR